MPCLSPTGRVLMGTAGMPGSLDGVPLPFPTFGGGCWLNDTTVLVCDKTKGLVQWVPGSEPAVLAPGGANAVAAGGGKWMAILIPRAPEPIVLFGSVGHREGAGFGDVASDGTIAFKTSYHAEVGATVIAPDGTETVLPNASPVDLQALPGGRAIWKGGGHGHAALRPALPHASGVVLVELDSEDWIVYWDNTANDKDSRGLIAQRDGDGDGYILNLLPTAFGYTAKNINGQLVVAWSRTSGEGPTDLVRVTVDRSRPRSVLHRVPGPIIINDEPKKEPEPAPMSLTAPNLKDLIVRVMRQHPDINTLDEAQRGKILDYAAAEAGPSWGRKSRNPQGTDLNTDAFCFLRPDGLFEIYDVISGGDGSATWDGFGPFKQGENGYWVPARPVAVPVPVPVPTPAPVPPPAPPVDLSPLWAEIKQLRADLEQLKTVKPPTYRAVGTTSRDYAHSHRINVSLVPEP